MKSILRARLFTLRAGPFEFSPGIIPSIVTLCLLYLMITLGLWQLDRAEYKDDLLAKINQRQHLSPVSMRELPHQDSDRLFMPVRLRGTFDTQHQFLYDNRIRNKQAGYHVYSVLHLETGDSVLVNRGWIAQGRTRDELPDLQLPAAVVEFTGLMDKMPSRGVILADNVNSTGSWPMMLQYVDAVELAEVTGYPLMSMVVWMDADSDYIFQHELPVLILIVPKTGVTLSSGLLCLLRF